MTHRRIIIYQDGKDAPPMYLGPFVSETLTTQAMQRLPEPLPGGRMVVRTLEDYGYSDIDLVAQSILTQRNPVTA